MRDRLMIGFGLGLLGTAVVAFQITQGAVRIVFPPEGTYVSGPLVIQARVDPPTLAVERVSFFADGKLVCTVGHPPFDCAWDAGPHVDEHQLRVVANLVSGARVVHTIRTKDAGYTETVEVDAVLLTATVTDRDGRFVRGLPRDAFRVFETDVPQKIVTFASENIPLELIVAADVSGSMADAIPKLKEAVKRFLTALRPADQVTLFAFNDNLFTLARPSADVETRVKAIDRLAAWGGTALYDVIVRSIDTLGRQTGRRALVVFSDGEDQSSHIPLATAEGRVEASDAVIYTIGQGRGTTLSSLKAILERLARVSGGRAFFTDSADRLDDAFAEIVDELSNQYLLGYLPTNSARDGTWRPIRVELTDKNYHVRARQGYRAVPR